MSEDILYFNGINAVTGDYSLPPMSAEKVARVARGEKLKEDDPHLGDLKQKVIDKTQHNSSATEEGIDDNELSQTGWGVIFSYDEDPAVRDAILPLLEMRKQQVNNEEYYKEFIGPLAYRQGETKFNFLHRHGAGSGPVHPKRGVPYYLLIVGSPDKIPFTFQYQLDVQFAVGRIYFDTLEEYAQYAQSVVKAETGGVALQRKGVFFGVKNPDDQATKLSTENMVLPLHECMSNEFSSWQFDRILEDTATKEALHSLLNGKTPPAFLYTASHGMEFPNGHDIQLRHQGALLCQNWQGPRNHGRNPITDDLYFSQDDLTSDANLLGTIAFFFACYGAGTPMMDDFYRQAFKNRAAIAPHPFIAGLPRRMLSLSKGGALAVIGHVERAWGYSFMEGRSNQQLGAFDSTLKRLLKGMRIGYAIEFLNERYAELATELTYTLEDIDHGANYPASVVAGKWTAHNDARGYAVIGDPAVRLPIASETSSGTLEREAIQPVVIKPSTTPPASPPTAQPDWMLNKETGTLAEPESFGLFGGGDKDDRDGREAGERELTPLDQVQQSLSNAVKEFANKLGEAFQDTATVQVRTYVSLSESISKDDIRLRAFTEIKLDGDMETCVPTTQDGEIDQDLWAIHTSMVEQARNHRVEMLKLIINTITGLSSTGRK
jgi:hypothetical protein